MRDEEIEKLDLDFHVIVFIFNDKITRFADTKIHGGENALKVFYYWLDTARIAVSTDLVSEDEKYIPTKVEGEVLKSHTLFWHPKGLNKRWGISVVLVCPPRPDRSEKAGGGSDGMSEKRENVLSPQGATESLRAGASADILPRWRVNFVCWKGAYAREEHCQAFAALMAEENMVYPHDLPKLALKYARYMDGYKGYAIADMEVIFSICNWCIIVKLPNGDRNEWRIPVASETLKNLTKQQYQLYLTNSEAIIVEMKEFRARIGDRDE